VSGVGCAMALNAQTAPSTAANICLRGIIRPLQRPVAAPRPGQMPIGLSVVDELFFRRVPTQLSLEANRDVAHLANHLVVRRRLNG
jgi:hypothetical protein